MKAQSSKSATCVDALVEAAEKNWKVYGGNRAGKTEASRILNKVPDGEYQEIDTVSFQTACQVFTSRKTTPSLFSRAALLKFDHKTHQGQLSAYDGQVSLEATFPLGRRTAGFPDKLVVDLDILRKVAAVSGNTFFLQQSKADLFAPCLGGQVYVPTYSDKLDLSYRVPPKVDGSWEVQTGPDALGKTLPLLESFLGSSGTAFVEIEPDGALAATDVAVCWREGLFPRKLRLRKQDLALLHTVICSGPSCNVTVCGNRAEFCVIGVARATVVVPEFKFSSIYLRHVQNAPTATTFIDRQHWQQSLALLAAVDKVRPEVRLRYKSGQLSLQRTTESGKRSVVLLGDALRLDGEWTLDFMAEDLEDIMAFQSHEEFVQIGVNRGGLYFIQPKIQTLVLFGKEV